MSDPVVRLKVPTVLHEIMCVECLKVSTLESGAGHNGEFEITVTVRCEHHVPFIEWPGGTEPIYLNGLLPRLRE